VTVTGAEAAQADAAATIIANAPVDWPGHTAGYPADRHRQEADSDRGERLVTVKSAIVAR